MFGAAWMRWGLALPLLTLNLFVLRQLLVPLAPFPGVVLNGGSDRLPAQHPLPLASCPGSSGLACDHPCLFGGCRNPGDLRHHVGAPTD